MPMRNPVRKSKEQQVEELSEKLGGRFRLTVLVQKKMADYVKGGRTFMPDVKNMDELFQYVLGEIEEGRIGLKPPEEWEGSKQLEG